MHITPVRGAFKESYLSFLAPLALWHSVDQLRAEECCKESSSELGLKDTKHNSFEISAQPTEIPIA